MCCYRIQRTTENNHRGVFELNCATVPLLNELIAIKAYEVLDSTKEKSSYNVEYNYSDIAKEISQSFKNGIRLNSFSFFSYGSIVMFVVCSWVHLVGFTSLETKCLKVFKFSNSILLSFSSLLMWDSV